MKSETNINLRENFAFVLKFIIAFTAVALANLIEHGEIDSLWNDFPCTCRSLHNNDHNERTTLCKTQDCLLTLMTENPQVPRPEGNIQAIQWQMLRNKYFANKTQPQDKSVKNLKIAGRLANIIQEILTTRDL